MKKIIFFLIIILLLVLWCLVATFHEFKTAGGTIVLDNNIHILSSMSLDDGVAVSQIDSSLLSWYYSSWILQLSTNAIVSLPNNMLWYEFLDDSNKWRRFYLRSYWRSVWRVEEVFTIVHLLEPTLLQDLVVSDENSYTILQWTWWSWIDQVKNN